MCILRYQHSFLFFVYSYVCRAATVSVLLKLILWDFVLMFLFEFLIPTGGAIVVVCICRSLAVGTILSSSIPSRE